MKYYNGENLIEINEDWEENTREAYREIILSQGYLPVEETPRPKRNPFENHIQHFKKTDFSYIETWESHPIPIPLDITKLMTHPALATELPKLIAAIKADEKMSKWLVNECEYLRGSEMAEYACKMLNMTRGQMESIVLSCQL